MRCVWACGLHFAAMGEGQIGPSALSARMSFAGAGRMAEGSCPSACCWQVGSPLRDNVQTMIAVCDISALARWGELGPTERVERLVRLPTNLDWSLAGVSELDTIDLSAARLEATEEHPLHILVSGAAARVRSRRVRSHIWSTPLPEGALCRLTDDVLLASPGFCLQQMAARSSLARIASVGMEICGCYTRPRQAYRSFYKRPPLVTAAELTDLFADNHGYGARRAREALAYVVDGSRSPMETVLVLFLILPVELGGCGLPRPLLNARVEIPPSLQRALGKPYLVVDLCWPELGIIFEYDSYEFHSTPSQVDSDAVRNEGLRDLGWMVRSITFGMLKREAMRTELVDKVMAKAGCSLPGDPGFRWLQGELVSQLMQIP